MAFTDEEYDDLLSKVILLRDSYPRVANDVPSEEIVSVVERWLEGNGWG